MTMSIPQKICYILSLPLKGIGRWYMIKQPYKTKF
jgi:hypothetical protein